MDERVVWRGIVDESHEQDPVHDEGEPHQAVAFRRDRVVLIQDYPDRPCALADVDR